MLFTSCEEVIDVDLPEGSEKLVVEGYVRTETDSSYIKLTKTLSYFDNTSAIPNVTNAMVLVNSDTFFHVGNGYYKPNSPYTGIAGTMYNLTININGEQYQSSSMLNALGQIDSIISEFKPKQGFIEEGYSVKFTGIDNRPRIKYTYFRFGFNGEDSDGKDSMSTFRVLYDNSNTVLNEPYEFELPVLRLKENDTAILHFYSVDEQVYKFLTALNNSSGGGPFSTPPANLPSNVRGKDVIGIFSAQDVMRFRHRITK